MTQKRLLFTLILTILTLAFSITAALDDTSGWPVEQRCVGEPTRPPEGWTFEGTIFTEDPIPFDEVGGGIHAIRVDVATPYFIAFNGRDFIVAGELSPDGRWYAVPAGHTEYASMFDDYYGVEELNIYSTDPSRRHYRLLWDTISRPLPPQIGWLDNEHLIYVSGNDYDRSLEWHVINPFTGEASPYVIDPLNYSPDRTRGIGLYDNIRGLYSVTNNVLELLKAVPDVPEYVTWFTDSSRFAGNFQVSGKRQLAFFDRDGNLVDVVSANHAIDYQLSFNNRQIIFRARNEEVGNYKLYLGDISARETTDLCLEGHYDDLGYAWSPSDRQLAFNKDGKIQVLDIVAWQTYVVAYHSSRVIAWREGW